MFEVEAITMIGDRVFTERYTVSHDETLVTASLSDEVTELSYEEDEVTE